MNFELRQTSVKYLSKMKTFDNPTAVAITDHLK